MSDFLNLFAEAFRLARERIIAFATVVVVSTAGGIAVDLSPDAAVFIATMLFGLLNLYLQAFLTASALGLEPARTAGRRFASVFGLSLLFGIAALFGSLLLLIPGLVLILRWSVSLPVLIAEESSVSESLGRSWRLTAARWWLPMAVVALFVVAYGPMILLYWLTGYPDPASAWLALPANLYVALVIAFQWLFVVALYRRLADDTPQADLPSIFS